MNVLLRWSTKIGVIGGILLGTLLTGTAQVQALTEAQVIERLRPVPVFTITDAEGAPLVASPAEGEDGPLVAGVFISQEDAQNFLNNLRTQNPELANGVRIAPVSLAEVYQLALQSQQDQSDLEFTFIPMRQEVETALSILQESGQNVENFEGVPLFIARAESADGGYLTIRQGERQVIPVFFEQASLQQMLTRLRQEDATLADSMVVQVINLENLIQTLQESDNEGLTQIELIPPQSSIDFVRSLQPQQPPTP